MTRNLMAKYGPKLQSFGVKTTGALALVAPVLARAADSGAVTAIETAKTDSLAVAGALVAMGVAIWGAMYLYRKFFK